MFRTTSFDRRKPSILDISLSLIFLITMVLLVFWLFRIETSISTMQKMQEIIVETYQKTVKLNGTSNSKQIL